MPDKALPFEEKKSKLLFPVKFLTLVLTMLLPVKFGAPISVPEVPQFYASDPFILLLTAWPTTYFCAASAVLACFAVLAKFFSSKALFEFNGRLAFTNVFLWLVLPFVAMIGFVNASCLEYAFQTVFYVCGLALYAFLLFILCSEDGTFPRHLLYAAFFGLALSCASGLYQYVFGFDAMKNFVENDVTSGGLVKVDGNLVSRISERRLSADFSSCNVFGCYVAMLFTPAVCLTYGKALSVFKGRRFPAVVSAAAVAVLLGRYVFLSGSRGAAACIVFGLAVASFFAVRGAKRKLCILFASVLVSAAFVYFVSVWRGFASAQFRLDYFAASFRMMADDPLCGTGWGDFFHDYLRLKTLVNDEAPHTPHNMMLFFGSQCGVIGFISALAVILLPLYAAIRKLACRRKVSDGRLTDFALASALASAFAGTLLDTVFETAGFFAVFIALSSIVLYSHDDENSVQTSPAKAGSIGTYVLFLIVFGCTLPLGVMRIRGEQAYSEFHELLYPELSPDAFVQENRVRPSPSTVASALERAAASAPFSPFVWALSADYMKSAGEFAAASRYFTEAIARAPERAIFYERRAQARCALLNGTCDLQVISDLAEAKRLSPKNPEYDRPLKQRLSSAH